MMVAIDLFFFSASNEWKEKQIRRYEKKKINYVQCQYERKKGIKTFDDDVTLLSLTPVKIRRMIDEMACRYVFLTTSDRKGISIVTSIPENPRIVIVAGGIGSFIGVKQVLVIHEAKRRK